MRLPRPSVPRHVVRADEPSAELAVELRGGQAPEFVTTFYGRCLSCSPDVDVGAEEVETRLCRNAHRDLLSETLRAERTKRGGAAEYKRVSVRDTTSLGQYVSFALHSRHVEVVPLADAEGSEPDPFARHLCDYRPVVLLLVGHFQIGRGNAPQRRQLRIEVARESFRRREADFDVRGEEHRVDHVVVLQHAGRIHGGGGAVHVPVETAEVAERDVPELRPGAEVDRGAEHLSVIHVEAEGRREGWKWADPRGEGVLAVHHDALICDREALNEDDRIVRLEPQLGPDTRECPRDDSRLRHEHRDGVMAHAEAEKAAALARF